MGVGVDDVAETVPLVTDPVAEDETVEAVMTDEEELETLELRA